MDVGILDQACFFSPLYFFFQVQTDSSISSNWICTTGVSSGLLDLKDVEWVQGDWKVLHTLACKNDVFKASLITSRDSQQQQLLSTKCVKNAHVASHRTSEFELTCKLCAAMRTSHFMKLKKTSIYQDDCLYTQRRRRQTLRSDREFHYWPQ